MKRLKITVYGRVQRVGYRDRVAEIARKLGIKGTVRNLDDEITVEITAEGAKLEEFLKLVNIHDPPIEVEKIDTAEEKPTGEFKHFKITRGESSEELGERIDVAGNLLYEVLGKQDQMLGKQDQMLDKQDQTINKLDVFHQDTSKRFDVMENKYGKVSDNLERIAEDLHKLVQVLETFKPK